ncbi:MAG: hypothetical protein HOI95_15455 [Chromatiales bacterium]|jgi:hypothetical protein|nr:hypothetical protein [Chromatiales bacterium]
MKVNAADKAYMQRLGEYKLISRTQASEAHLSQGVGARLQASWRLWLRYRGRFDERSRVDDPSPFYQRARQLGFYEE